MVAPGARPLPLSTGPRSLAHHGSPRPRCALWQTPPLPTASHRKATALPEAPPGHQRRLGLCEGQAEVPGGSQELPWRCDAGQAGANTQPRVGLGLEFRSG